MLEKQWVLSVDTINRLSASISGNLLTNGLIEKTIN